MKERIESLKRAVAFGQRNKKHNMIVDLDVLAALIQSDNLLSMIEGFLHHVRVLQSSMKECNCDLCCVAREMLHERSTRHANKDKAAP